ncbi:hypothetical protein [Paenibacillus pinihumi]|uniref:hypothetical protein n=1 Tax=Paenibacillus pinihumi TaxID=669462 RepID=UPI000490A70F|nr:hypothetical protein [Paenibacillus pinihumi]
MKKFVVGVVVGAALTLSVTAAADSLSYVGKKVTSETAVFLDGMPFDTAAIVDGTSLAPIRRVYETAGYKVTYKDGKVYLESPKTASNGGDSLNTHSPDKKESGVSPTEEEQPNVKAIETKISFLGADIWSLNLRLNPVSGTPESEKPAIREELAAKEKEKAELEKRLAELKASQIN